jgi:hypothetical protein
VTDDDRCPSCGLVLGEKVSTRYKGALTVIRFRVPDPDDPDADRVEREHVCGD